MPDPPTNGHTAATTTAATKEIVITQRALSRRSVSIGEKHAAFRILVPMERYMKHFFQPLGTQRFARRRVVRQTPAIQEPDAIAVLRRQRQMMRHQQDQVPIL